MLIKLKQTDLLSTNIIDLIAYDINHVDEILDPKNDKKDNEVRIELIVKAIDNALTVINNPERYTLKPQTLKNLKKASELG
jgi:hypothetical protein